MFSRHGGEPSFLQTTDKEAKGWLLSIVQRIERLDRKRFSLSEIYAYEDELSRLYPNNRYVKQKIRQQL